jgi:hypothetical protein
MLGGITWRVGLVSEGRRRKRDSARSFQKEKELVLEPDWATPSSYGLEVGERFGLEMDSLLAIGTLYSFTRESVVSEDELSLFFNPKCLATQLRQKEVLVAHSHDRSIYPRCSAVGTRLACLPRAKTQLPRRNSTARGQISLVRQRTLPPPSLLVLLPLQYAPHDKPATDTAELRLSRTLCVLGTNATLFESSS